MYKNINETGRSMIEMLGVLAIVGVLSVGGIAGYSKAMEKWKVNKAIEEYSYLIYGLQEHLSDIHKMPNPDYVGLIDLANSLNLIPNSWTIKNNFYANDAYGNLIGLAVHPAQGSMPARISFDLQLGGIQSSDNSTTSPAFSINICRTLFTDLIMPINDSIWATAVNAKKSGWINYYAQNWCDGDKLPCLRDLTVSKINELCRSCDGSKEVCSVNISF